MRRSCRRPGGERGAILVLTALMITALVVLVAIVVDLGATRSDRRGGQLAADNAAAAAGGNLGDPNSNAQEGCEEALRYLATNLGTSAFVVDPEGSSCADFLTACSSRMANATINAQRKLRATSGGYVVWIHYPVVAGTTDGDRLLNRTSTIGGGALASTGMGNLATDACARMGVELQTSGEAFFGGIAGREERTTTVHAVVFGRPALDPNDTPAFVMLERVDCGALVENNARGIFVEASNPPDGGPAWIHADSLATGECGGETKGYVVYGASLPNNVGGGPSIRVASYPPPTTPPLNPPPTTVPGRITVAAETSTGRVAAVVGGNNPGINVTPTGGEGIVSRRPVDRKYNSVSSPAITALHTEAYVALTTDPGYSGSAGCDGVVTPANAKQVLVTCANYTSTTAMPEVEQIEFTGSVSLGNNQTLTLPNATRVVVRGQVSLPQGSLTLPVVREFFVGGGVAVGNTGSLAIRSTVPTACAQVPLSTPPTKFVVFGGSPALQLNNSTAACWTAGYLAGPLTAANSTYAGTGAVDPNRSRQMLTGQTPHVTCTSALPCPRKTGDGNTATGATFSFGNGTVLWQAPNQHPAGPPPTQGLEDLALWFEGAETASMGSNAVFDASGVIFAPNARLNLQSPTSAVPKDSQFIARSLWLYQGRLLMKPTPSNVVEFPSTGGSYLIR